MKTTKKRVGTNTATNPKFLTDCKDNTFLSFLQAQSTTNPIIGIYDGVSITPEDRAIQGNAKLKLIKGNLVYYICERNITKEQSAPRFFLIQVKKPKNIHISGLFPVNDFTMSFDTFRDGTKEYFELIAIQKSDGNMQFEIREKAYKSGVVDELFN